MCRFSGDKAVAKHLLQISCWWRCEKNRWPMTEIKQFWVTAKDFHLWTLHLCISTNICNHLDVKLSSSLLPGSFSTSKLATLHSQPSSLTCCCPKYHSTGWRRRSSLSVRFFSPSSSLWTIRDVIKNGGLQQYLGHPLIQHVEHAVL